MSENIIHILPEMVASQIAAGEVVQRPFSVNDAIGETPNSYSMTMEYNKMSSPVQFNQMIATKEGNFTTNNTYHYDSNLQPNAPIQISNMYYTYDAAGNPTSILDASGIGKDLEWNADNQLRSIVDTEKGLFHSYTYDHTAERFLKRYGSAQSGFVNGKNAILPCK